MPSKDSIKIFAVRVAVDIAINGAIMVALIIIRPLVLRQLAGHPCITVEPQLLFTPLPPDIGSPQCPESGSRSSSSLQIGSFVYALIFVGISTSRDEMKQVQAILGIIIKAGVFLASGVVREFIGRSLSMAAYSVKTLRARLEAIPRYLGFLTCLGLTTCSLFSMINQLKMAITCLFSFVLGVVVTLVYHHFQSLSTYGHIASLSLLASDLTDRAEILFVAITKSNSVLATVLFSLGLRFLVRSILSFSTLISPQDKEAQKLGLNAALLVNDEEKQDSTILVEDESFASDKVTLCDDDEVLNLNVSDDGEDESTKNISPPGQDAVSIPTPVANDDKEDGLKQQRELSIISNPKEDLKYSAHIPSFCANPDRSSLRQQQADRLNSRSDSEYTSSLSAFTPEFVPRFHNSAAVCNAVQDYYPPHWALASPVSVRITAPDRIRRGVCLQANVENSGD